MPYFKAKKKEPVEITRKYSEKRPDGKTTFLRKETVSPTFTCLGAFYKLENKGIIDVLVADGLIDSTPFTADEAGGAVESVLTKPKKKAEAVKPKEKAETKSK